MQGQTVRIVSQAIRYIEEHLHEKMDLDIQHSVLCTSVHSFRHPGFLSGGLCTLNPIFPILSKKIRPIQDESQNIVIIM